MNVQLIPGNRCFHIPRNELDLPIAAFAGVSVGLSKCLLWVKRVILTVRRSLPVYPEKRTTSESVGMSQRCQRSG